MSTLFLEAFGQLAPGTSLIDSEEEDLYSVFNARAELMSWSTTAIPRPNGPLLWGMEEAELTAGTDASRIGFVQVGLDVGDVGVLEPGTELSEPPPVTRGGWYGYAPREVPPSASTVDPAIVLPALVQCFDDALRRFGVVDLSGLQLTASHLDPSTQSRAGNLVSALNWFNTTLEAGAHALIAFDNQLLGDHTQAQVVTSLKRRNTGSFQFGPVEAVPEQHRIKVPAEGIGYTIALAPAGLGVSVTLPEWTASTAAWVLAVVIDTARATAPDVRNFAVRVTRVR